MSQNLSKDWSRVVGRAYVIEGATARIRGGVAAAIKKYNDEQREKVVEVRQEGNRIAIAVSKGVYGMVADRPENAGVPAKPGINIFNMTFADIVKYAEAQDDLPDIDVEIATVAPTLPNTRAKQFPRFARIKCQELTFGGGTA